MTVALILVLLIVVFLVLGDQIANWIRDLTDWIGELVDRWNDRD